MTRRPHGNIEEIYRCQHSIGHSFCTGLGPSQAVAGRRNLPLSRCTRNAEFDPETGWEYFAGAGYWFLDSVCEANAAKLDASVGRDKGLQISKHDIEASRLSALVAERFAPIRIAVWEFERFNSVNGMWYVEIFDSSLVVQSELIIMTPNLRIFVCHPRIDRYSVVVSTLHMNGRRVIKSVISLYVSMALKAGRKAQCVERPRSLSNLLRCKFCESGLLRFWKVQAACRRSLPRDSVGSYGGSFHLSIEESSALAQNFCARIPIRSLRAAGSRSVDCAIDEG